MSKKKEKGQDLSADEIIDTLAHDVGAGDKPDEQAAPVVPPADPVAAEPKAAAPAARPSVKLDKDKGGGRTSKIAERASRTTMTQLLMDGGGDLNINVNAELEKLENPAIHRRGPINLVLLTVLVATVSVGFYALAKVSSSEAREERRQKRLAIEEAHLAEQLAKQKKFGNLRIDSTPPGALVQQDGKQITKKDPVTGEELPANTPLDVQNLDIAPAYKFTLTLNGYEPFEVTVAEHLWSKVPGAEDYQMIQMIDLVPNSCEYWFLYDGKLKKEMKFPAEPECKTYRSEAQKKAATLTDCTCKVGPPQALPSAPGGKPAPKAPPGPGK